MVQKITISLFFSLVICIFSFSCDNENNQNEIKEIKEVDSRLVGGKWYDGATGTNNSYFKFTKNKYVVANNGSVTELSITAYTKGGKVLDFDSDGLLLTYEFLPANYYDDDLQNAIETGNISLVYQLEKKQKAARTGNMVRFGIPGVGTVEWARWENIEDKNKVPSFFHGTWYRIIYSGIGSATGRGIITKLEKIIIDETTFTAFGYDHYVSEPVDITYFLEDFNIIFNENTNEYEVIFSNYNVSPSEFRFKKSLSSNETMTLSVDNYSLDEYSSLISLSYRKIQPTQVYIPEWVSGWDGYTWYSTTNLSYSSYNMHVDYYPFDPKIYEFIISRNSWPNIVIREFKGYSPGAYPTYYENHYFNEIFRGVTNNVMANKTRFYFKADEEEYFLERDDKSSVMYFGSTNEDNIFYNKVNVSRRTGTPPGY